MLLNSKPLEWIIPEKLFLQDINSNGDCSMMTYVEVTYVPGAITGISFAYASGAQRTIGSREGDSSTFHVRAGEKFTLMEVTHFDNVTTKSISVSYGPFLCGFILRGFEH